MNVNVKLVKCDGRGPKTRKRMPDLLTSQLNNWKVNKYIMYIKYSTNKTLDKN